MYFRILFPLIKPAVTDWSAIFAMGTLTLLPVLIIFLIFQKYIVQGLVTTGLKG
ncbi:MAG TPA: hypothetical protein PLQ90_11455 [Sphaerochaeta sp.]|nr:hypothetical protein [Sphaerochaeta sp.]